MDIYKRRTYRKKGGIFLENSDNLYKKKGGETDSNDPDNKGPDYLGLVSNDPDNKGPNIDPDDLGLVSNDPDNKGPNIDPDDLGLVSNDPDNKGRNFSEKELKDEVEEEDKKQKGGYNIVKDAFDQFLKGKDTLTGGEVTEVREGYDSFTIVKASEGNIGGRFISKTPYTAASKAAARLFKSTKSNSLTFVMQKTTKGSNKRYYAYEAIVKYLSKPILVFKNDEEGNKIIMNNHGQVLRINKNKKIINSSNTVKKDYNPDEKISSLTSFNYKPYIIKKVTKNITIKAIEVPSELKEKQMEKAKNKMTDEQKEKMKQKKAEKKAREAAKKAAEKEKEKKRKEKERERARRQKEKEKEQASKEKLRNKKMMIKGGNGMCSLNGCM